jgi:hypothetical protein
MIYINYTLHKTNKHKAIIALIQLQQNLRAFQFCEDEISMDTLYYYFKKQTHTSMLLIH